VPGIARSRSSIYLDFQSELEAGLAAGTYTLVIKERIWNYKAAEYATFSNLCEKFSLSIQIVDSSDNDGLFRVCFVM
jgi:hypothetical protein